MKKIKIFGLGLLLVAGSSCKKWLDVNSDPVNPDDTKAQFLLAPILSKMAYNSAQDYRDALSKYTQNMGSQAALDTYERHGNPFSDVGGNMWRHVYISAGINLEDMISKAEADGGYTLVGVGYAVKAWGFQQLTDYHGPVILDEAFRQQQTSFRYNDQPDVYKKVREWCFLALANFNKTDAADYLPTFKKYDYLFGTTLSSSNIEDYKAKWRKFIYAILASQYIHLTNKPEFKTQYADSVVKYVDLSFNAPSENAAMSFVGSKPYVSDFGNTGDSNPLSVNAGFVTGTTYFRVGQPIVNYLTGGLRGAPTTNPKTSTDPRLSRMLNPMVTTSTTTNGVYRGVQATVGDVATTKTIPHALGTALAIFPGKYIFGQGTAAIDNSRYPFYTYAQLQLMKAEALFIKGDLAGAYTAYKNGITGHMQFINEYGLNGTVKAPAITAAEITAYMTSSEVAQTAADLKISDIMGQKYIVQWGWAGLETFCDLRKYHYDVSVFTQFKPLEASQFVNKDKYVYRHRPRYNSEYIWNRAGLAEFGGLDADYVYKETWFSLP